MRTLSPPHPPLSPLPRPSTASAPPDSPPSSDAAAIGGGIGGGLAALLLIGVGVAAYYGKLPCCGTPAAAKGAELTGAVPAPGAMVVREPAPAYASAPADDPVAPVSVAFCSKCGARQTPGTAFCGGCGDATGKLASV